MKITQEQRIHNLNRESHLLVLRQILQGSLEIRVYPILNARILADAFAVAIPVVVAKLMVACAFK